MTPLSPPLGAGSLVLWRLDRAVHAGDWDSGEGSFRVGGRWSPAGVRAVYASLDPATAILEVVVHKGFRTLDVMPHILTSAAITDPDRVRVVQPDDLPDLGWLRPGVPRADQQAFGARRLGEHAFILIPSVVSTHSWNLVFDPALARGVYETLAQEPFVLDPRLHSPPLPRGADGD